MNPKTAELWAKQNQHEGDRWRLFTAVGEAVDATTVLYPGSYVDIAPSFVFDSVTYVDIDKRAPRFFADTEGIREIVAAHNGPADPDITFIHADYTTELDLPREHFDLLVSLYAGFVSEHCTRHLRIGGTLLVNPSHGDTAMASIDPRYELAGTITSRDGGYRVNASDLDAYLIPNKPKPVTIDLLHEAGRNRIHQVAIRLPVHADRMTATTPQHRESADAITSWRCSWGHIASHRCHLWSLGELPIWLRLISDVPPAPT